MLEADFLKGILFANDSPKTSKICMQIFRCGWQNEAIERSVCKQRAGIIMKREVMHVSSRRTLLKDAMASLETFAMLPQLCGFLVNPGPVIKIASWGVNNWTVRICNKINEDSEKGE